MPNKNHDRAEMVKRNTELESLLEEVMELDKAGMLHRDPLDTDDVFKRLSKAIKKEGRNG